MPEASMRCRWQRICLMLIVVKIILIVLLCLLLVVAAFLAYVLLVPISYTFKGDLQDEKVSKFSINDKLRFFKVFVSFQKMPDQKAKIDADVVVLFGLITIPLFGENKNKKQEKKQNKANKDASAREKVDSTDEDRADAQKSAKKKRGLSYYAKTGKSFLEQARDERNKKAVSFVLTNVKALLSKLRFVKKRCNLTFCAGRPDITGETVAFMSMFPVFYGPHMRLLPDFESDEAYLRGTFFFKGFIKLIYVLKMILVLYGDKNVRRLFKKIK